MKNRPFTTIWLSTVSYADARTYVRSVLFPLAREGYNFLVCCRHPPTLTFGKNMPDHEVQHIKKCISQEDADITFLQTDRGGKATYHDQNQLMLYPISYLPNHMLGPKSYIEYILFSISDALKKLNIDTWIDPNLSGVWADSTYRIKVGSVGFRFIDRYSEHGVSLYTSDVSNTFYKFNPCGERNPRFVSFFELLGHNIELSTLFDLINAKLNSRILSTTVEF